MAAKVKARACEKCGEEMQEGFMFEHRVPLRWIAGKPETSFMGDLKKKGKAQCNVAAFRCVGCGYLELYAVEEMKK